MLIFEVLGNDVSIRKTVWSKRGDKITRRVVDKEAEFDIEPRTHIKVKEKEHANESK